MAQRTDPATPVDPVALTADLVRCASVTPADAGAQDVLQELLGEAGFLCIDRKSVV